jgi:hypothetical protein
MSLVLGVLENKKNRNVRIKKILESIFNRNMEIELYVCYNQIKRLFILYNKNKLDVIVQ